MSASTDLVQENLAQLHALTHLLVKKKVFTPAEWDAARQWFRDHFKRVGLIASALAYKDPAPSKPPEELTALLKMIQDKLFEGA